MNSPLTSKLSPAEEELLPQPFEVGFDLACDEGAGLSFSEFGENQVLFHAMRTNARVTQVHDRESLRGLISCALLAIAHLERVQWLRTAHENEERESDYWEHA